MAGNSTPIYSRVGDIQGGAVILTQATSDYSGTGTNVIPVFTADATNGGYIQRLRFKAVGGTTNTTVARIWINEGTLNQSSTLSAPGQPSATATGTGTSLLAGTFYAKVQAIDQYGGISAASTESAGVTVTAGQNIPWTWTVPTGGGAAGYRLYVGLATGGEYALFTPTSNTYTQTIPYLSATAAAANNATQFANPLDFVTNNMFYGEVSLPIVTVTATAATVEIDYPMNFALPPGYRILIGLGTTVTSGWAVTAIGGKY